MITKYNKFNESKLIVEDGTGNEKFDDIFNEMTEKSTKALKKVNDKYYNHFSQDGKELKVNNTYWGIFTLPSTLTESVQPTGDIVQSTPNRLLGKLFWCRFILNGSSKQNNYTWFTYKLDFSLISNSLSPEDKVFMEKHEKQITLYNPTNENTSNGTLIRGYYIFEKPQKLVPTLKTYFGQIKSEDEVVDLKIY